MAINHDQTGQSVYTAGNITERTRLPLYRGVKELVLDHSATGIILDLGCSDGVATYDLGSINNGVYGVNLSTAALEQAQTAKPGYLGIKANLRQLPLSRQSCQNVGVDTVLLLDVLEHESRADSRQVLEELRSILPADHTLIVSMPIISPLSRSTWREGLSVVKNGRRPDMGLFDRTHQILTGVKGHRRLFSAAGYAVDAMYQTNDVEHLTGDWKFDAVGSSLKPKENESVLARATAVANAARLAIRGVLHPSMAITALYQEAHRYPPHPHLQSFTEKLVAYQGLYVLKPQAS